MNVAVVILIGLALIALVILVLWRTGYARDMVHGIQIVQRDSALPKGTAEARQGQIVDPVCGMTVAPDEGVEREYAGRVYRFCSTNCRRRFDAAPERFVESP